MTALRPGADLGRSLHARTSMPHPPCRFTGWDRRRRHIIWAARAGQFDDLETPAMRILHDEAEVSGPADRRGAKSA